MDFELVSADDCVVAPDNTSGDVAVTYTNLEEDLIAQIKVCTTKFLVQEKKLNCAYKQKVSSYVRRNFDVKYD